MKIVYRRSDKVTAILEKVSETTGITVDEILGRARQPRIERARRVSAYLLRRKTDYSLEKIANLLGMNSHSSIIHHMKVLDGLIEVYPEERRYFETVQSAVEKLNYL